MCLLHTFFVDTMSQVSHLELIVLVTMFATCITGQQTTGSLYQRRYVALNPNLENFKIASVSMKRKSEISCAEYCSQKRCVSFVFDSGTKMCTLYSVYMSSDGGDVVDYIYALAGAVDNKPSEIEKMCSAAPTYNSSFRNVARGAQVNLSSLYGPTSVGSLMVNGIRDPDWPCACTTYSYQPYMIVDLGQAYNAHSVYILNRYICCPERLFNLRILFGESMDNLVEKVYHPGQIGNDCTFVLNQITRARFVKLQIDGTSYLTICEFEVYSIL